MGENTRTALIGIIVEDAGSVEELNELLHQYRDYIIGRMGIPHSAEIHFHHQHCDGSGSGHGECTFWKAGRTWKRSQHKNDLFEELKSIKKLPLAAAFCMGRVEGLKQKRVSAGQLVGGEENLLKEHLVFPRIVVVCLATLQYHDLGKILVVG